MNTPKATNFSGDTSPVKTQTMKIIGILSGSGPSAGAAIENDMLHYLQNKYKAVDDLDYPDYILYNKPLRGFWVTWIERPDLVEEDFVNAMKKLNNMGAEVIGIACNTLHELLSKVEKDLDARVINMIHETCKQTKELDNILVLCSESTTKSAMYENYLKNIMKKQKVRTLHGEYQKQVDEVIEAAMWWTQSQEHKDIINKIIEYYQSQWTVDAVILWCTELPLAYSQEDHTLPVISSNQTLAQTLVESAKDNY